MEVQSCLENPKVFLSKYAYIQNRNTGQTVKWESWDFQLKLLDTLLVKNKVVIAKARQLGISWLIAGYCLWKVLFSEGAKVLFISQGEEEAWDMIDKARFILEHLPPFLRLTQKHQGNKALIDFIGTESIIKSLPSTGRAGRSTDATIVVRDELAKHPEARECFASIGPTIDAGAQLIDLSTIDKEDVNNYFTERVFYAQRPDSNVHLIDLCNWRLRPVRIEGISLDQWFEAEVQKAGYTATQIEAEYPTSLEEALSAPKTTCRFDVEAINELKQYCESPQVIERNGIVKIYKVPVAGRKYCLAIDPSEGDYDPSLGMVIDAGSGYPVKVAEFYGKIPLDEQAIIGYDFYERYHKPYTAVERNASGLTLIEKLKALGIENWHYYDKSKNKEGWWTSPVTRPAMIMDLAEAVRLRQITEPNEDALREFLTFIRTAKKPEGEARGGCHDEYVMAWAISLQIRKHIPTGTFVPVSFKYSQPW